MRDPLEAEYDELLLKQDKTDKDYERIVTIEHEILRRFAPYIPDYLAR